MLMTFCHVVVVVTHLWIALGWVGRLLNKDPIRDRRQKKTRNEICWMPTHSYDIVIVLHMHLTTHQRTMGGLTGPTSNFRWQRIYLFLSCFLLMHFSTEKKETVSHYRPGSDSFLHFVIVDTQHRTIKAQTLHNSYTHNTPFFLRSTTCWNARSSRNFAGPYLGQLLISRETNPGWEGNWGGKIESALHISHIVIDSDKWKIFLSAQTRRDLSVSTTDTPRRRLYLFRCMGCCCVA